MILAHSLVCSPLCKCYVNEDIYNKMKTNYFTYETFSHLSENMKISNLKFNIENCSEDSLESIQEIYNSNPKNNYNKINDFKKFHSYWKGIEKRFKCTGWCKTKYTNIYTLKNDTMMKYIFSDINRDIVSYPGCLNRLVNWIPFLVAVVGTLLINCGVIQLINFIFTLKLMNGNNDEDDDDKNDNDEIQNEEI